MVDKYAVASIVIRSVGGFMLFVVLGQQAIEYRRETRLRKLQAFLILVTVCFAIGNGLSIGVNLFRNDDGNLITTVRHIAMILNAIIVVTVAGLMNVIYKFKGK